MSSDSESENQHFTQAVTELGARRTVVASEAIFNAQGVKIVERGTAVNQDLYERLMAHKLQTPLEQSVSTENAITGHSLRADLEAMLALHPFYRRMASAQQTTTWLDIVEKLPLPAPLSFQLTLARELHPRLYNYSLRSAWATMWMVYDPTTLRFDLGVAASMGLLHDMAMLHLDPVLLDPRAVLTRELRRQLYSHPIISARLLERHLEFSKDVIRAVLEHHECDNGSGYPRNLTKEQLSPMGRTLALSTTVAAIVGGHHPGGELRLSVLLRMNTHRFDRDMIARVIGLLRPEEDPGSHDIQPLSQPQAYLQKIHASVQHWPADVNALPGITPERQQGLSIIAQQLVQLQRSLIEAGLTPAQLEQLGDSNNDPLLPRELSLLATEAAWQLRTLARQARRRWRSNASDDYPPALQQWLDESEPLCAEILTAIEQANPANTPPDAEAA